MPALQQNKRVVYNYGIVIDPPQPETPSLLEIELIAFRTNPPQGLGREEHFWNICGILWGAFNKQHKKKYFERNPWTERMAYAACREQYLGLSGCSASGKTEFAAVWAIVNWLCAPEQTLVFCTSTSLKESNRRIWGRIKKFWQDSSVPLPGKLVDSMYTIRTDNGSGVFSDEQGIVCIAGEKKNEKEAIGKMIGAHPKRLLLLVDEAPEITPAVLTAALSNMAINPFFQMIAIGNFKSIYDTFGVFVRPKGGYATITLEDEEWDTELGLCLRFDGMHSPNVTGGRDVYECYTSKDLATHRKNYGDNSAEFWRMCRSFPCPEGDEHVIYSEADFIKGDSASEAVWLEPPIPVSAADPSFTTDGDNFAVVDGLFGLNSHGIPTLQYTGWRYLYENMSLTLSGEPRDLQTARQFADHCRDRRVAPAHAASDASGPGGLAFGSILTAVWSNQWLPVKFGESPSDRPVSEDDPKRCDEAFVNKVTELWFAGRNFVRSGQIKGLPSEIAKQWKARQYETVKGVTLKMKVEPKRDMKARVGFSPDLGDAALELIELCRERFGFTPGAMNGMPKMQKRNTWLERATAAHEIYNPEHSFTDAALA